MSEFNFGTYVKPTTVNPYAEVVAKLDKLAQKNPDASVTFSVAPEAASTAIAKFRKAANDIDRTATLAHLEDGNNDFADVTLTFTIGKRQKGGRGRKPKSDN